MSITSRFRHTLTVKRNVQTTVPVHDPAHADDGDPIFDDYGQPVIAAATVATVQGLVQPRKAYEVERASQAGAVVADYVGYLAPLATLGTDCWLEWLGDRYDVLTISDAGGLGHHYEITLRRVS